jgi:peptidoglycan/LPS O-acetylase OafA/YrhL
MLCAMLFFDFSNYNTLYNALFGRYLVYMLFLAFFCFFIFNNQNFIVRIKKNKLLDYLGSISFGIYMYHMIVLFCVKPLFSMDSVFQEVIFIPVVIAATIVLSAFSYRYIETPFLKMKSRFEKVKSQSAESTPAVGSLID